MNLKSFRMDQQLNSQLKKYCQDRQVSEGVVVRNALKQYMAQENDKKNGTH